jgi:TP901 family phage tail tape measure protein
MASIVELVLKTVGGAAAERDVRGVGDAFSGLGGIVTTALGTLAGSLMHDALNNMKKLGSKALDMAGEFEQTTAVLGVSARSWGKDTEELREIAMKVGADTRLLGVTSSGAAEAMLELARAGIDSSTSLGDLNGYMNDGIPLGGALGAAIRTAAASELDMVKASELGISMLANFGHEMEKTGKDKSTFFTDALDELVRGADASTASVKDLQASLIQAGPMASAFRMSISEVNTSLGLMANAGIKGTKAGTALRSMLNYMIRDTAKSKKAWKLLEMGLYDAEGNMRPLRDVIDEMGPKLAGLTEKQQDFVIKNLAGVHGQKALLPLLKAGAEGWDKMASGIANAAGTAEYSEARMKTLSGAWEAFEGKLEAAGISIMKGVLPAFQEILWAIEPLISRAVPALQAGLGGLAGIMGALVTAFTGGENWITKIRTAIEGLGVKGGTAAKLTVWLAKAIVFFRDKLPAAISSKFIPAIKGTIGPIAKKLLPILGKLFGWLKTSIPIAIAFLSSAWTDTLQPAIATVWGTIKNDILPAIKNLFSALGGEGGTVMSVFAGYWDYLKVAIETFSIYYSTVLGPLLGNLFNWLAERLPPVIQLVATVFNDYLIPAFTAVATFIQEKVIPVMAMIAEDIFPALSTAITFIANAWSTVLLPAIQAVSTWFQEKLVPIFQQFSTWWKVNWPEMLATFKSVWERIKAVAVVFIGVFLTQVWLPLKAAIGRMRSTMGGMGVDWEKIWNTLKTVITTVAIVIGSIVTVAMGIVIGVLAGLAKAVSWATNAWFILRNGIAMVVNAILLIVRSLFNLLVGIFTLDGDKIKESFSGLVEGLMQLVEGLFVTMVGIFTTLFLFVSGLVVGFVTGVISFFVGLYNYLTDSSFDFKEFFTDLWDKIVVWVTNAIDVFVTWLEETWEGFKTFFVELWEGIELWWETLVGNIKTWMEDTWQAFVDWLTEVWTIFKDFFTTLWEDTKTSVETTVTTLITALETAWSAFDTWFTTLWTATQTFVTGLWEEIRLAVVESVQTLISTVQLEWIKFKANVKATTQALLYSLKIKWALFKYRLETLVRKLKEAIIRKWEQLKAKVIKKAEKLIEKVKKAFTETDWEGLGKDLIKGIIKGMWAKVDAIKKKAGAIVKRAIAAAKKAAGIQSPSTVAAAEVGSPIGEGMMLGVGGGAETHVGAVIKTVEKVFDHIATLVDNTGGKLLKWAAERAAQRMLVTVEEGFKEVGAAGSETIKKAYKTISDVTTEAGTKVVSATKKVTEDVKWVLMGGVRVLASEAEEAYKEVYTDIATAITKTGSEVIGATKKVTEDVKWVLMGGVRVLASEAAEAMGDAYTTIAAAVKEAGREVATATKDIADEATWVIVNGVRVLASEAEEAAKTGLAQVRTVFRKGGEDIAGAARRTINGVEDELDLAGVTERSLEEMIESIKEGTKTVIASFDLLIEKIANLMEKATEIFIGLWKHYQDTVTDTFSAMHQEIFTGYAGFIYKLYINTLGITGALIGLWESFGRTAGKTINAATTNIIGQYMRPDWEKVGRSSINGMIRGVESRASALAKAIVSAVKDAMNAARVEMGISSPSKVAAQTIGAPIMEGVRTGIVSGLSGVLREMKGAMNALSGLSPDKLNMIGTAARPRQRDDDGPSTHLEFHGDIILPGVKDGESLMKELQGLARSY